jgi:hypothetical protein
MTAVEIKPEPTATTATKKEEKVDDKSKKEVVHVDGWAPGESKA